MSKKVLILGTAFPHRGGIAAFNERLAQGYKDNGDDVHVVGFKLQYPSFLFPGKSQFSDGPKPDLNISSLINSVNPFNWFSVGRKLKKEKYDLVIVRFWIPFMAPCLGVICRILKKNKNTKIISILDNVIPHEKRIGDNTLIKYFLKAPHAFITMAKAVNEDLKQFNVNKPSAIHPHPIYNQFGSTIDKTQACEKLNIDSNTNYFLFFGFIRNYKGLDLLLQSVDKAYFKEKNYKLIVAGEFYESEDKYLNIIKERALETTVILKTDFIPDDEVHLFFSVADMVLLPYKTATQSGITQIAYHFNTPMLVTNVGGLGEMVPHDKVGYVVEKNTEEINSAIRNFVENNRKTEFQENIKIEKQRFSWSSMVNCINELAKK